MLVSKNPLKTTMKTSSFKTRLIGKALFSFNPATQELWGDKTKMQDLIGGSVVVFQTFTIKPWAFWIHHWAWHKLSPSLFNIILKEDELPCITICRKTKQLQKDRATSNTTCFLFVTWHKSSSCRPMWQFAGGQTYSLVMKMGEMVVADIQVVIIMQTGVDRDTELELYRSSPQH